jgi:6-pyruvoyltetrahydropterin/6-carboxytetrahydropterin synthase
MITATRYHDFCSGHRVAGHENKCAHLHGHNYRIHFHVAAPELDTVGRVMDFSIIKERLCDWLEENWDHKFLMWEHDPKRYKLSEGFDDDMVITPFNPTAENMAQYLCETIAPDALVGTGCVLIKCVVEETRKCSASYEVRL